MAKTQVSVTVREVTEGILDQLRVLNRRDNYNIPDDLLRERANNIVAGLWSFGICFGEG
jgi:hypothetical protein